MCLIDVCSLCLFVSFPVNLLFSHIKRTSKELVTYLVVILKRLSLLEVFFLGQDYIT